MAEAYFPVGPGLGPEENFLSLDDILMSQEKLPGRAESNLPRLAFALGQGTGAGSGDSIPQVTGGGNYNSLQASRGAVQGGQRCSGAGHAGSARRGQGLRGAERCCIHQRCCEGLRVSRAVCLWLWGRRKDSESCSNN
uniref:Uncharacterized protein n=1 Tax=Pavo cristatus TaxID=9049 RepID=A0A8C9FXV4_PAVCR